MSKKQKTIMLEPNNQYENLQAKSSFETDDIADLTESLSTKQTNELTNVSEENESNSTLLNLREASWVW
ncbi:3370_t:CDS:1, partial [Cetraspora pellucida]